jgi:hypothetical protein
MKKIIVLLFDKPKKNEVKFIMIVATAVYLAMLWDLGSKVISIFRRLEKSYLLEILEEGK